MTQTQFTPSENKMLCFFLIWELKVVDGISRRLFQAEKALAKMPDFQRATLKKAQRQLLERGLIEPNIIEGRAHGTILSDEGFRIATDLFACTAEQKMFFLSMEQPI